MMKKNYLLFLLTLFTAYFSIAQQAYYTDANFDFTQTGDVLKDALGQLISNASTTYTYGDVRADFEEMELDPDDNSNANVLLTYGFVNNLSCTSGQTDRRIRDKGDFGGGTCEFNREHVFARSNANPSMGSVSNGDTGIAADPQNLRATDVQRNGSRGSRKFGAGSGNSGVLGNGDYYPGDEWRGDVARIMMYMFTRYGDRCLPSLNASGVTQPTNDMLQILLQWNVDDPVSEIEDNRNNFLETEYLNRNPFIDNPALATVIWGGPEAQDRWGNLLSIENFQEPTIKIFPNPVSGNEITIVSNKSVLAEVYDVLGKKVTSQNLTATQKKLNISGLKNGVYLLRLKSENGTTTKKLIRQ